MGYVALFVLVVMATHVPSLMPAALSIDSYPPDLWILLTLYIAFRSRGYSAVGWGIGLGVVRDAVSLDALGTNAFVLGFVAWLFAEGRVDRGRIDAGARVVLTFAGVVAAMWIYAFRVLPLGGGLPEGHLLGAFPVALWSALFGAMLFPLLDRYHVLDDVTGVRESARRRGALPA